MKALSLILRIVTLAVIIALGAVWFMKKDEISAINTAYEKAGAQLNIPDQPLSKVITKGMNDLTQTQAELRDSQAQAAKLDKNLKDKTEELTATEDRLRTTSQTLRNTTRDLEEVKSSLADAEQVAERLTAEMKTVRSDLIRVNKEKFELSQKIESVEEEKRALARRVEQLSDSGAITASSGSNGDSSGTASEIARLREQNEDLRAEITSLKNNPLSAALSVGTSGDDSLAPNQVLVKSINLDRGLIVLRPSSSDEFVGVSTMTVNRDGAPVAKLKLRGVYPDYIVAEILPDSIFADALQSGSVYTFRK